MENTGHANQKLFMGIGIFLVFFMAALLASFTLPSVSFAKPVGGVQNGVFNVAPHANLNDDFIRSWITYKAPRAAVINDAIDLENLTNDSIELTIGVVDAANPDKDHFALKNISDPKEFIAKWVNLDSSNNITLKPKEILTIPLTINVPAEIQSGEYWGGVTFEETDSSLKKRPQAGSDEQKGVHYLIKTRLGIRTMVRISDDKNVKIERLLLATKPNIQYGIPSDLIGKLKNLSVFGKVYVAITATYFIVFIAYFLYDLFRKKKKISTLVKSYWVHFAIIAALIVSFFVLNSISFSNNNLNSVLGGGGKGFSIMPASTVNENGNIDSPSWLILKGAPGETIKGKVIVTNQDDTEGAYALVSAADATVTGQGAFALEAGDAEQVDIGKWLTVDQPKFYLNPKESKEVSFSITLPDNLQPGDHAGGITVQTDTGVRKITRDKKEESQTNGSSLTITTRVGVRVYLTASGVTHLASEFSDFKIIKNKMDNIYAFSFNSKNTGNVNFKPSIDLNLNDQSGSPVDGYPPYSSPAYSEMLPGKIATITIPLPWKELVPGKYQVKYKVSDGTNVTANTLDWVVDASQSALENAATPDLSARPAAPTTIIQTVPAETPVALYIMVGAVALLLLIILIILLIILMKRKNPTVNPPNQTPLA